MSEMSSPPDQPPRSHAEREAIGARRAAWLLPAAWLLRTFAASWRVELRGCDPFAPGAARPVLAAIWHTTGLVAAGVYRDRGVHVAVSQSRDGGHIDSVLRSLGFGASPRGSSSRGASRMLLGSLRHLEAGGVVAILVDGPRGPAGVAKSGVISGARLAGVPVLPVVFAARPCLRFASWDRMRLPLPFARVVVQFGTPLEVPRDASDAEIERLRERLEQQLHEMSRALDGEVDGPGPGTLQA
jgi:hypothetical protein